jgi:hypothetical protein
MKRSCGNKLLIINIELIILISFLEINLSEEKLWYRCLSFLERCAMGCQSWQDGVPVESE